MHCAVTDHGVNMHVPTCDIRVGFVQKNSKKATVSPQHILLGTHVEAKQILSQGSPP